MNEREELIYLTDLLLASQNWTRTENDDIPVVLEIRDRISKLTSVPTDHIVYSAEPEIKPEIHNNESEKRWKQRHRRVKLADGSIRWFPLEQCMKVPTSNNRFKWALKDPE